MGINKNTLRKRAIDLLNNMWSSTLLFIELPKGEVFPENELYMLEKRATGAGVKYRAVRVQLSQILDQALPIHDEGFAATTYLASETYDEVDAAVVYAPEETFSEDFANAIY